MQRKTKRAALVLSKPFSGLAMAGCILFLLFSIADGADFTGDWDGYVRSNYDGSTLPISASLYQYGSSLSGTVIVRMDEYGYPDLYLPFSGTVSGNIVSGTAALSYPGTLEFRLQIYGVLSGNTINGTYNLYAYVEGEELTDTGTFVLTKVITTQSLSVAKSGTGSGTVSSSPPGIYCGTGCSASFYGGTVVTLTAVPDGGSYFASWTGCDGVSGNVCTVTMNYGRSVTAVFTASPVLAASGSLLYVDYGSDGIWQYDGSTWTRITPSNPEAIAAAGSLLYGDFGSGTNGGIWQYDGSTWTQITRSNPEAIAAAGSLLYGDFGPGGPGYGGIWQYDGSTWTRITPSNPEAIAAAGSLLYGDFGPGGAGYGGIWQYDGSAWTQITRSNPEAVAASGSLLYGDFGPGGPGYGGIWKYDGSAWTQITRSNPEAIAAAGSLLYGDFGPGGPGYGGIWQYDGSTWTQITPSNPYAFAAAGSVVYGDFGPGTYGGIWMYDGTWIQIRP